MVDKEEYVEQAYLFRVLRERLPQNMPLQTLLRHVGEELLASTRLPMALDFLRAELEHSGTMGPAMARLPHYFTPFQTYVVREAEDERGRFDMRIALEVLRAEAEYRTSGATRPGMFLYQFETLCRHRLQYDPGLKAMAEDPIYDPDWSDWILLVRRQVGLVDIADLMYVRSAYHHQRRQRRGLEAPADGPILFGEREGKIAWANRAKDPLFLFSAMQRHLGYPAVPRVQKQDETVNLIPQLLRRLERLEARIKLMEEEQRDRDKTIDLSRFYERPS